MKPSASRRYGLGLAAIALMMQPVVRAANLTDCIIDVLKLVSVDAGDATKGYLQAAEEDNVLKLATTSKDITNDFLQTVDSCKGASVELYPDCSTAAGRPESPPTRSCGGDDQVVQATGDRRCAQYAHLVNELGAGDIFFGKQAQYVFHCNNHAFDGVNGCFYDCSTCSQCTSEVAPAPSAPAGADPATATKGLTGKGNRSLNIGPLDPSDQNPDDVALANAPPSSRKQRKRDNEDDNTVMLPAHNALSKRSLLGVKSLFGRVNIDDLTPVPNSLWWKYTLSKDGYTYWGKQYDSAWTLSIDKDFTSIRELTVGTAPKNGLPTFEGTYDTPWESDHVLEAQILSQFFNSNRPRYNFLLRQLVKDWRGYSPPEAPAMASFSNYGNPCIQQVAILLNGQGNVQPLVKYLNGYKGGLFYGRNTVFNANNDLLVTGVLNYMIYTTAMHDATAHAIGQVLDNVPNAGGRFGGEFETFARTQWRSVWTLLQGQYNQAAANQPLLAPPTLGDPVPDYPCAPPLGLTAPPPPP